MKKPKVLFKKLKALYFIILIILDLIIAKLKTFFLKMALIDFSREFIDKEEINIFLRKYNYQNHNKFKNFTNDKLEIAINYPYQYGIYNLSELVIDIFKNNLLNKNELNAVQENVLILFGDIEKKFIKQQSFIKPYKHFFIYLHIKAISR